MLLTKSRLINKRNRDVIYCIHQE